MANGMTKEVQEALDAEKLARAAWYQVAPNGKATNKEQGKALRTLEKAKAVFVKAVGAENFRAAAAAVGYSPQYAVRTTRSEKTEAEPKENKKTNTAAA